MRVIRRVYNTFAFQSCDIEVPAVGTGSTSIIIILCRDLSCLYGSILFVWIYLVCMGHEIDKSIRLKEYRSGLARTFARVISVLQACTIILITV